MQQYVEERQLTVLQTVRERAGLVKRSKGELWEEVVQMAERTLDTEAVKVLIQAQKTVYDKVVMAQIITGMLKVRAQKWLAAEELGMECRHCGEVTHSRESEAHAMWGCTHLEVVTARRVMQHGIRRALAAAGVEGARAVAALAMWQLTDDGTGIRWEEIYETAVGMVYEGVAEDVAEQQAIEEALRMGEA